jgi:hypothetical protein
MHSFDCEVNPVIVPVNIAANAGQRPGTLCRCRYPILIVNTNHSVASHVVGGRDVVRPVAAKMVEEKC